MKSIEIKGKRNVDKLNKISQPKRSVCQKWILDDSFFDYKKQIEIINKLYLNENVEHQDLIVREISNKQKGYQKQDVEKKILNKDKLINYDQIIELLVVKKLKCYYCDGNCSLLYKKVLERKQWTLDRINNDLGHNYDNIVLCCLDCNIKRGNMNSERFKSGKTIKIVKKEF
tara:strand:+ start:8055 stop:8570 length:516 start_codon:yes stop_codon:yes gene_type:complete